MQKFSKRISALLVTAVVVVAGLSSATVHAQSTASSGNGLRISPVRTDISINAGESKTIELSLQNTTKASADFRAIVNDFIAGNDEFGQPSLILDDNQFAPSHSLKRYIAAIPNVEIGAGQTKTIKVTINMPKDSAAGGYYGAVRFAPVTGNGKGNVSLTASVGSLVLVKVPGDIKENMTLESFDVRSSEQANSGSAIFFSNKNLYAVARFKNSGNVHEQPFGKVLLKKGNKVVQTSEINDTTPKSNVLPDSIRRFSVKLDKVGMWGKYTVEGNFGYGSSGQLVSGKSSFFVIPLLLIIIVVVLLALAVFALVGLPRAIKKYNEKVVRRATRRK